MLDACIPGGVGHGPKGIIEKKSKTAHSDLRSIPSARSGNTGLNSDELVARDLFQECVCVSPSGVAFSI